MHLFISYLNKSFGYLFFIIMCKKTQQFTRTENAGKKSEGKLTENTQKIN